MADVKFNVEAVGIPKVKSDLRSVFDEQKKYSLSIVQLHQNNAQRIKEIREDTHRHAIRLEKEILRGNVNAARQSERLIEDMERKITRIKERESLKRQQIQAKEAQGAAGGGGINSGALGHMAQAAGFFRLGHALRAMQYIGVGGLAMAAAITPVVTAFYGLAEAAKFTTGAFMGAVATLGGARGLQANIVEAGQTQRLAANIAVNSTDRLSTNQVLGTINSISGKSEFTSTQVAEMARGFVGKTGNFGQFAQLGGFATDLASVAGLEPGEAGSLLGQITTQFPGLSLDQVKQAAMSMWGLGRSGAVELKDTTAITQALGFGGKISHGNILKGLNTEMGLVQMAQRFTGGQSADQAVVGVRRLQEEMLNPNSTKAAQMRGSFGANYLGKDPTGQLVFRDFADTMAKAALGAYRGTNAGMFEERGNKALMGIAGSVSNQFTGNREHDLDVLKQTFKAFESGEAVVNQFTGAVTQVKDTIEYQLRKAFDELSTQLQGPFLKTLKDIVPSIETFISLMVKDKELIPDLLKSLGAALLALVPIVLGVGEAMLSLNSWWMPDDVVKAARKALDMGEATLGVAQAVATGSVPGSNASPFDAQGHLTPEALDKAARDIAISENPKLKNAQYSWTPSENDYAQAESLGEHMAIQRDIRTAVQQVAVNTAKQKDDDHPSVPTRHPSGKTLTHPFRK